MEPEESDDIEEPGDDRGPLLSEVRAPLAHNLFFSPEGEGREFTDVLKEVQEYISSKYSTLIIDQGSEDVKDQIKRYITKYVQDYRIAVKGMDRQDLVDTIYTEMAEFSFLTKYVYGTGIEEIDVNSWRDIEVQYSGGVTKKLTERFESPQHAINVIRRMLHVSGMVLDNASPASWAISAEHPHRGPQDPFGGRGCGRHGIHPYRQPAEYAERGLRKRWNSHRPHAGLSGRLPALRRFRLRCRATGSGKTTVAGWLLTTIPDNKRIFTIENGSRELDLVREKDGRVCNSVIHTITRESENAKQNIDQDMLLDMALRYHPDIICVGEMRSAEAYAAQEAARTGHGVLTTIHSNSSQATWRRMVTLCKRKHEMADDTLMDLVTEAFPVTVFAKQLEDKSRKSWKSWSVKLSRMAPANTIPSIGSGSRKTGWRMESSTLTASMKRCRQSLRAYKTVRGERDASAGAGPVDGEL